MSAREESGVSAERPAPDQAPTRPPRSRGWGGRHALLLRVRARAREDEFGVSWERAREEYDCPLAARSRRPRGQRARGECPPGCPGLPWDRMKDMAGVLEGFVGGVRAEARAALVLAGPAVDTVGDDPEDREIWDETVALWQLLAPADRARLHLVAVPMDDPAENALVIKLVAAARGVVVVQRRAWPRGSASPLRRRCGRRERWSRAKSAASVDQVVDGETGLFLRDPTDLDTFGRSCAASSNRRQKPSVSAGTRIATSPSTSCRTVSSCSTPTSFNSCSPNGGERGFYTHSA